MYQKDLDKLNEILSTYKPKTTSIDIFKKKYKTELENYIYIDNIDDFIGLKKGVAIKPIKKSSEEIQKGGIVVKIDKNSKNKWFMLVTLPKTQYFWKIYFDDNYIFYRTQSKFIFLLENFLTKAEIEKYSKNNYDSKINNNISNIVNKYKRKI